MKMLFGSVSGFRPDLRWVYHDYWFGGSNGDGDGREDDA